MGFHQSAKPTASLDSGGHVVHFFTFDDLADMATGTDSLKAVITLTTNHEGMHARVGTSAPYDFYVLTNATGPVWEQVNGGGGADATKLPLAGGEMSGNITMAGTQTVDGRDLSIDGAKLDGIEAGATADQDISGKLDLAGGTMTGNIAMSGAETVDGRDLSVDGAKLDGVEAGSDVTDATNVTAAGALMRSGGELTGNITMSGVETVDGRDLSVDGAKLDGIAAGAQVNVSEFAADVLRIQDNVDATKQAAFAIAGLTTATTRTYTLPDFDAMLSQARSIRESGGTDLALGAVADGQFLQRSGATIIGAAAGSTPTNGGQDWSGSNYYSGVANTLAGNAAGFVTSAFVRFLTVPLGEGWIWSNCELFQTQGGWGIGYDATTRFKFGVGQASDGTYLTNFGGDAPSSFDLLGKLFLLTQVYDGTDMDCFVNGQPYFSFTPASGYEVADSGNQPMIGRNNNAGSPNPSSDVAVLGCAYDETVPTAAQVAAHYTACFEADEFVDGGVTWSNKYTFDGEASGPATLSDSGDGTAVDLTESGTITTSEIKRRH